MQPRTDALTDALRSAALCLFIVLALMLASAWDTAAQIELEVHKQSAAERLEAVRNAYQAGLEEGSERERYARQRFLADMEQGARP